MQPATAGKRLQAGKADILPVLPANAGAQEFVAPLGLAQRLAGAGNGRIGLQGDWPVAPTSANNSSTDFTAGAGTASTVNGPVTRTFFLSTKGWS
ncbi:hypothetical protein [Chloracidobacterium aggregatum]|uniref:hypothetical protein n=1 Tax=Chloracidobacterium aggregatum TaxID=2851959 RepID=UPI001B8ABA9F|nr:hypothetical protein J8C04_11545 [Chloracidobacterium sp. A]